MDRSRQVALLPLVLLAHVDEQRMIRAVEARVHVSDVEISSISSLTSARSSLYVAITFQSIACVPVCWPEGRSPAVTTAPRWCSRLPSSRVSRTRVTAIVGVVAAVAGGAWWRSRRCPMTALPRPRAPPRRPGARGRRRSRSISASAPTARQSTFAEHSALRARATPGGRPRCSAARLARGPGGTGATPRGPTAPSTGSTQLAGLHPKSPVVQLNLGTALFWSGQAGSKQAWQEAADAGPDTNYAVVAGNLLYPAYAPKLPIFVPAERAPRALAALQRPSGPAAPPARAKRTGRHPAGALFYGVALQSLGRQLSAERVYARAARRWPNSAEAQVAAAVGRFDKAQPAAAFSRLGPLTRRFRRPPRCDSTSGCCCSGPAR